MCHGWQNSGFFTSQKKVLGKSVILSKVLGFSWFFPFVLLKTSHKGKHSQGNHIQEK